MQKSIKEILEINNLNDLPSDNLFLNLPRNKHLQLKFSNDIDTERQRFGEKLKTKLEGYLIGIHTIEPIIGIRKLMTNNEIDNHQEFFEECAYDYRELATKLILQLAQQLKVDIQNESPYWAFLKYWQENGQKGTMGDWNYYFHGFHCHFIHKETKQEIEASVVFGLEFGDLDPYFFTNYILSTPEYQPLEIDIYENYHDGLRIIERMTELGRFEKINSTFKGHQGTVVKNRPNKVEIQICDEPKQPLKQKQKFNFFRFLGFK